MAAMIAFKFIVSLVLAPGCLWALFRLGQSVRALVAGDMRQKTLAPFAIAVHGFYVFLWCGGVVAIWMVPLGAVASDRPAPSASPSRR